MRTADRNPEAPGLAYLAVLAGVTALAACGIVRPPATAPAAVAEPAAEFDPSRTEPPPEGAEEEEGLLAVDPQIRMQNLARRFPGLERLDVVKTLVWGEDRFGACWTEVSRPWEMDVDLRYEIDGEGARTASGFQQLKTQGWRAIYRTPHGSGFERRGDFRAADLTLSTTFACRCDTRSGIETGDRRRVRLRFRWTRGKMPEVSAATIDGEHGSGLTPALTTGELLTYDFAASGSFPGERPGSCGVHVALTLLGAPPIL